MVFKIEVARGVRRRSRRKGKGKRRKKATLMNNLLPA